MTTTFKTYAEMSAAGWRRTGYHQEKTLLAKHGGYEIRIVDTTGPSASVGDRYGIRAVRPYIEVMTRDPEPGRESFSPVMAQTLDVFVSEELTRMNRPGCYVHAFPPGTVETGVRLAREWIDQQADAIS